MSSILESCRPLAFNFNKNRILILILSIDNNISNQADANITNTVLFSNLKDSNEVNLQFLNASINFIQTSKRFDEPLLNS